MISWVTQLPLNFPFFGAGHGRGQLCWGPARETGLAPRRAQLATPSSQPTRNTSEDGLIAFGVCSAVGVLFLQGEVPLKLDAHAWRILPVCYRCFTVYFQTAAFPFFSLFFLFFFLNKIPPETIGLTSLACFLSRSPRVPHHAMPPDRHLLL